MTMRLPVTFRSFSTDDAAMLKMTLEFDLTYWMSNSWMRMARGGAQYVIEDVTGARVSYQGKAGLASRRTELVFVGRDERDREEKSGECARPGGDGEHDYLQGSGKRRAGRVRCPVAL